MSSAIDQAKLMDQIEILRDETAAWFTRAIRKIFYPSAPDLGGAIPSSYFGQWVAQSEIAGMIDPALLSSLKTLYADMQASGARLMERAKEGREIPAYDEYDKFGLYYEEYMNILRRIERDFALGGANLDLETGFRAPDMFFRDIARELERLARHGSPFCLALIRLDDYPRIKARGEKATSDAIRVVTAAIKKTLRSFDEAYRMGDSEFMLSLKQTTSNGGVKAVNRIRNEMDGMSYSFNDEKGEVILSLSACVAQPLPDDNIRALIDNMRRDLAAAMREESRVVLEFMEISPLQRLLKEGRE